MSGVVVTVKGSVAPTTLGVVLPHEHLFVNVENWFVKPENPSQEAYATASVSLETLTELRYRPYANWDNLHLDDDSTVAKEVVKFKEVGGGTIVDLSVAANGRDPVRLRWLSEETGVHVVAGSGYYVATSHPPEIAALSTGEIADILVKELTEGIGDSGVRPGVLGEVGTSYPITPDERKVLLATAAAQRRTGAPISVHLSTGPSEYWIEVLDVLTGDGVDPGKIVLGHLDGYHPFDLEAHTAIASRGAFVEYDLFGVTEFSEDAHWPPPPSDLERIDAARHLWDLGLGNHVLLSHDVCTKTQQTAYGGFGFAHLPGHVVSVMLTMGFEEREVYTMLQDSPARWLTWDEPSG